MITEKGGEIVNENEIGLTICEMAAIWRRGNIENIKNCIIINELQLNRNVCNNFSFIVGISGAAPHIIAWTDLSKLQLGTSKGIKCGVGINLNALMIAQTRSN